MKKVKNKGQWLIKASVFLFSATLVLLASNLQLEKTRFTTDLASFVLSGIAPIFKIGSPYVDYWGINPPGLLMFKFLWGLIAGTSLRSFHVLYIILLSMIVFLVWRILNKFFSLIESCLLFFIFSLIFFSKTAQSQFFPSEINGLFFTLIGLFFTLKNKASKKDFFWASFSFIMAGQMKEVFAFTGLALLPQLLRSIHLGKKQLWKFIIYTSLGMLASTLIIVGYLQLNNAYTEYQSILGYKSKQFSLSDLNKFGKNLIPSIQYAKEIFIHLKYSVPILLFLSFNSALVYLSLIIKSKKSKNKELNLSITLPKKLLEFSVLLFFWIGSTIGYILQGRYGNKYEIQSLLPMILIVSLSVKVGFRTILEFFKIRLPKNIYLIATITLLAIFLTPKKLFFAEQLSHFSNYNLKTYVHRWINLENPEAIALETKIKNNTEKTDCITAVYGWGIGSHYYYSQRPSCSKHFLINLLPSQMYQDYQQELLNTPPQAIIYITENTDMNIPKFEQEVFNFSAVLKNCYQQDNEFKKLYWPIFEKEELKECLEAGIPN